MDLGFDRLLIYWCLFWLGMANITDAITLTVIPSSDVAVNQSVTLQCDLDPNPTPPIVVFFKVNSSSLIQCYLEPYNGVCKNTDPCQTLYSASCPSNTRYSLQVTVPKEWNGVSMICKTLYATSRGVVLFVRVPVTSVTLTPPLITLIAGQEMNLTCTTHYGNPPANVTWYKSSVEITSQSTSKTEDSGGLVRTVSSLRSVVVKEDNGKQLYCRASNIPDKSVTSSIQTINVMYKPEVRSNTPSPYRVIERQTATLTYTVIDANPNTSITLRWIKTDSPNTVLHNGPTYTIPSIARQTSGSYSCTANNSVGTSEAATVAVDVQYKPEVRPSTPRPYRVIERQTATLTCTVIDANPNTSITWRWIKTDSPNTVLHYGPTYTIPSITRERSGSYSCTASNSVGTSEAATVEVDVQYKPEVRSRAPSPYRVIERQTATLACTVIDANPNTSITWRWINTDSPNTVLYNGSSYVIPRITRERSGSYSCTANNSVGTSEAAIIVVDVQYKPSVLEKPVMIVNRSSDKVIITREISSNPLSNVSWYDGPYLLKSEISVKTTTFIIEKARCTDTKNFTLIASNTLQWTVISQVELIVNCKPISDVSNITVGVTNCTGLAFSTTVIAYPKPNYVLMFENGTTNTGILDSMTVNAVNNFTIHFSKRTLELFDYGTYHLRIYNTFGETIVFVSVIPERIPDSPRIVAVTCNVRIANLRWISSFNGGVSQTFIALASIAPQESIRSEAIYDSGENRVHETQIQNLQPFTSYLFYVIAQNKHGSSLSEKISCKTLEETRDHIPVVAGSIGGSLALITLIFATVCLVHRRYTCSIRFEKRKRSETSKENEGTSHYTTMAEQEKTERNLYEELKQNENQYEAVLKDREGDDAQMYEKLQKTESIEKQIPSDDISNVSTKNDFSKQIHDQPMTGNKDVYMNTSFME